jgi:hypothetical protein
VCGTPMKAPGVSFMVDTVLVSGPEPVPVLVWCSIARMRLSEWGILEWV